MKKKWLSGLLVGSLCLALSFSGTAYADGQKVVTLGADLTDDQKAAVLKYFGVLGQSIETLTITNQDERNHLGSYVPLEQIGTKTFSCALVSPTNSGGIHVKTANLSWVTSNMIATTLSTSGVTNCDVLAASPFEVSGTGALTGIIMAYETASGSTLDPVKKELATQELIATGTIANEIGQQQATNIVNEIKIQVIEGAVVEPEEVEEIVDEVVEANPEVTLSDEDRALLTGLMTQIAEQQYDYEEMKDTLQRVDENVNDLSDQLDEIQTVAEESQEEEEIQPETLASDSILMNTDDSALGEGVLIDATNEEAVQDEEQPETETTSMDGFDITTTDDYTDSSDVTDEPSENADASVIPDNVDDTAILGGEVTNDGQELPEGEFTDDGTTIPDENGQNEEAPVLELGTVNLYHLKPDAFDDSSIYAGTSQFKVLFEDNNIVPVSGNLKVTDAWGNTLAAVDLADKDQVSVQSATEKEKNEYFWTSGTQLLINAGIQLSADETYTISLEGIMAQTEDPAALENAPKAEVNEAWELNTESCGIGLAITHLSDVKEGAVLSGNVILSSDMAYAEITTYDDTKLSFDVSQFDPEYTEFHVTCLQSGNTEFAVDFYDADGNYIRSAEYEITIQ